MQIAEEKKKTIKIIIIYVFSSTYTIKNYDQKDNKCDFFLVITSTFFFGHSLILIYSILGEIGERDWCLRESNPACMCMEV